MSDNKEQLYNEFAINNDTDSFEQSAAGAADDNYDGDADCIEERVECYTAEIEEVLKTAEIPENHTKLSKPAVAVISSVVTFIICAAIVAIAYVATYNPYNANKEGYLPTLEDLASEYGMTVDEVKDAFGLPKNMRSDTITAVALDYMPAGLYVEMNYGLPFDSMVEALGLSGDKRITPDMRFGEFEKIVAEVEDIQPATTEEAAPDQETEAVPEETEAAE